MPVVIFTHVPPQGDAKLFFNPNNPGTINSKDQFENLLSEHYKDANSLVKKAKDSIEQKALDDFIERHANIKAYFHGHENNNEFYTYRGIDKKFFLDAFRVDSPIKGKVSSKDETKLSLQLISVNKNSQLMTVRECLWNTQPMVHDQRVVWGIQKTISLECP